MPNLEVKICVLGGGPAGCIIARSLAQLGHATLLIERNVEAQGQRVESLAPPIMQILDSLELSSAVAAATFCREKRALVRWNSNSIQTRSFEPPSHLIERSLFDRRLRDAAASAGAYVLTPASAQVPQRRPGGGWLIPVRTTKGLASIVADFLVDARGKRRSASSNDNGPRTVAMSAAWSLVDKAYAETRIEAGADEWFWGCPLRDGRYLATIFVDAKSAAGLRGDARGEFYRRLLSGSELLNNLLRGEMVTPISVRDATGRIARDLIGEDFIRVGEAAFSIDPLSSQGVQSAILSAIQGAAAVHTIRTGYDPLPAMTFYRDRQQHAANQASRNAMRLYRDRLRHRSSPFWIARSGAVQTPLPLQQVKPDVPSSLPPFVRLSDALQIVDVPVLCGTVIKQAAALSHPNLDHPIAYVGGIALAPLAADLIDGSATEQLMTRWAQRMPSKTARNILRWMYTSGVVEADSGRRPRRGRVLTARKERS
jgi:flavin-dependent dehydrogenase